MRPNQEQIAKLGKLVDYLYKNGMINKDARFTDKGLKLQHEFTGSTYDKIMVASINFHDYAYTNNLSYLKNAFECGYIWLLTHINASGGHWYWICNMGDQTNLDHIIRLNYKMFKIPLYPSELERAADLLADNEFEDI